MGTLKQESFNSMISRVQVGRWGLGLQGYTDFVLWAFCWV